MLYMILLAGYCTLFINGWWNAHRLKRTIDTAAQREVKTSESAFWLLFAPLGYPLAGVLFLCNGNDLVDTLYQDSIEPRLTDEEAAAVSEALERYKQGL